MTEIIDTGLGPLPFVYRKCCRVWLIVSPALFATGRCKLCGQVPETECSDEEIVAYNKEL